MGDGEELTLVRHVHALIAAQGPLAASDLARLLHPLNGMLSRAELAALMLLIDAERVVVSSGKLEAQVGRS